MEGFNGLFVLAHGFNSATFYSRLAGRVARILGGLHHLVIWQGVVVLVPWRAGAEEQGDEEQRHYGNPSPWPRVFL